MNPRDVVIVGACRTAIGKNMGQFKDVQARDLAICAGTEAIKRAGIDPKQCDEIVMGECFLGMQGSLPASGFHENRPGRDFQRLHREPELRFRYACYGHRCQQHSAGQV